jgi:hypothetical protein
MPIRTGWMAIATAPPANHSQARHRNNPPQRVQAPGCCPNPNSIASQ